MKQCTCYALRAIDCTCKPAEYGELYTSPTAKQEQGEPVAWMKEGWGPDCGPYIEFYRDDEMGWRDRKEWTPLYTPPQPAQKPWVELTKGEIESWKLPENMSIVELAWFVETKVKEKNI